MAAEESTGGKTVRHISTSGLRCGKQMLTEDLNRSL